jgi:hypothetical protein
MFSRSRRGVRLVAVLLGLALAAVPVPALALQEAPPPTDKPKPKPSSPAPKGGQQGDRGGPAGPQQAPPTLLLSTDLACVVKIDGRQVTRLRDRDMQTIGVAQGQHLLEATSEDGRLHWKTVVDAKPGQQVVQISLATAGTIYSNEDFDRTMAGVWLGISDLKVAGAYAASILNRSWGFHDQTLSTALHTAHSYLTRQIEELKRITPSDPGRKRMAENVLQVGQSADKYIDLLTKAISEAQRANSWMGNPNDMYGQARALEPAIVFPSDALSTLMKSRAFQEALPPDRQVALGLARDPRDFNLGAEYYQSTPNMLAVVVKGGLADDMGFSAGDRIISVNAQAVRSVWELKLAIRANAGRTMEVVFERQGKQRQKKMNVPAQLR